MIALRRSSQHQGNVQCQQRRDPGPQSLFVRVLISQFFCLIWVAQWVPGWVLRNSSTNFCKQIFDWNYLTFVSGESKREGAVFEECSISCICSQAMICWLLLTLNDCSYRQRRKCVDMIHLHHCAVSSSESLADILIVLLVIITVFWPLAYAMMFLLVRVSQFTLRTTFTPVTEVESSNVSIIPSEGAPVFLHSGQNILLLAGLGWKFEDFLLFWRTDTVRKKIILVVFPSVNSRYELIRFSPFNRWKSVSMINY